MARSRAEATLSDLSLQALQDVPALVDLLVPMLVEAEPPDFYTAEMVADLRSVSGEALSSVLTLLAGIPTGERDPLEIARIVGRRQVRQNLPLEGVLSAYRIAGGMLWDYFVAQARSAHAPIGNALIDGVGALWRAIDLFSTTVVEAYRAEEAEMRQHDDRVQSAVLAALLEGRGAEPQFARDAAQALGLPPGAPLVCIVALTTDPGELVFDNARQRLRADGVPSAWMSQAGSEVGLVVLTRGRDHLRRLLEPGLRSSAGMSPVFNELGGVPRAFRLAEIACRGTSARPRIRDLEDDLLAGLVSDSPLVAQAIYERTVAALLVVPDGRELLDTVRTFLAAEGVLQEAARVAYVHRNTMLHRLKRVERHTGVSVQTASGQVHWMLGLKHHDMS